MSRAAFTTLGCKVNQYETQRILETFYEAGFEIVPFDSQADVYVINTCSVTSAAEAKSRYTIRRARRANPEGFVVATGCAAQMAINKGESSDADLLVANPDKEQTLAKTICAKPSLTPVKSVHADVAAVPLGRTRATLKIQDGCNVLCSYCSIPFTRPQRKSRHWNDVLAEAKILADRGYLEAVLTGVLIGDYGPETGSGGPGFEELVETLAHESGLHRLRVSSIETQQVTDGFLDLVAKGCVVPHLHIPLQSGDSKVLQDMNRRYDSQEFLDRVAEYRRRVPGGSLTTDVMVGFPTEDQASFERSLATCRAAGFLKAHVFRFSPRWGTPADKWGDPVPDAVKQQRSLEVTAVAADSGSDYVASQLGRIVEVVIEGKTNQDGLLQGHSEYGVDVRFSGSPDLVRSVQHVKITETDGTTAYGEWCAGNDPAALVLSRMARQ